MRAKSGWLRYGFWADSDNRRFSASEHPGVHASNFGGTSLSPGAVTFVQNASHMMWFPKDWRRVVDSQQLPVNTRDDSISRPAYVLDAKTALPISFILPAICPALGELQAGVQSASSVCQVFLSRPQRGADPEEAQSRR